jgi:hypothetical protein
MIQLMLNRLEPKATDPEFRYRAAASTHLWDSQLEKISQLAAYQRVYRAMASGAGIGGPATRTPILYG